MTDSSDILKKIRRDAITIYNAALKAVDPIRCINQMCSLKNNILKIKLKKYDLQEFEKIIVIGAGKASAAMASALETILGNRINSGCIITKYGHGKPLKNIEIIEASHPIPNDAGVSGTKKLQYLAETADEKTLVICLLSGGGSALTPSPALGITLLDKQKTTLELLRCGATIHEVNTIRKHLSAFKGGWLAKSVFPATMINLVLSDVVGDDLSVIASGPGVPDTTTFKDCLILIENYGIKNNLPIQVLDHLNKGVKGLILETPKPDDPIFKSIHHIIIANNMTALLCAQKKAISLGYDSLILSSIIEGESKEVAKMHSKIAKGIIDSGHPIKPPACILTGGETTVTLKGDGKGGRNQEFALACAQNLSDLKHAIILSCGTDGTDGPTDAAGAMVDYTTINRATALKMNSELYLKNNNAYPFFENLGDLIKTGPTLTNVMDLQVVLVR